MISSTPSQRLGAGALAILVHGLFILALLFTVSWKALPHVPVYADLWDALPALPEVAEVMPEPPREAPALQPPVSLPPPEAQRPAEPPAPPAQADIALREKQAAARQEAARRQEEENRLAEERRKEAQLRQEEEERQADEAARLREQQRVEAEQRRQAEARRAAVEQARRELEAEMARHQEEELAREAERLRRVQQRQALVLSARTQQILEHQELIRTQIHQYVRRCDQLAGNPEVVFRIQLKPDGEIKRIQLLKSSGNTLCDQDVERAVLKAVPLPLPADKEAARAFTREPLELRLRPNETPSA